MSQYDAVTPTKAGQEMLIDTLNQGKPLIFTKIEFGDGIKSNQDNQSMTALIHKINESSVIKKVKHDNGNLDITTFIDNKKISVGFFMREIGVWAKVGEDGTEKLFAYTYATNASYTPSNEQLDEKQITICLAVGALTDNNIKMVINSDQTVTMEVLEAHNQSDDAHPKLFKKLKELIDNITSAFTTHKNKAELDHPEKSVKQKHLADACVGQINLQNRSVGSINIQTGAVGGEHIKSNAITSDHLATNCISQKQLQGKCIDYTNIKSRGIYEDNLASACVTSYQIRDGQVTPEKLSQSYVTKVNGLTGDVTLGGILTKNGIFKMDTLTHSALTKMSPYKVYYRGDVADYVTGLTPYSTVFGFADDKNSNDSWQLAFDHNYGGDKWTIKYRHLTRGDEISTTAQWLSVASETWVSKAISKAISTVKQYIDDKIKEVKSYIDDKIKEVKNTIDINKLAANLNNSTLGIKTQLSENGYLCLGWLFFGITLQWGYAQKIDPHFNKYVAFPLQFKKLLGVYSTPLESWGNNYKSSLVLRNPTNTGFYIANDDVINNAYYFAIGY